MSALGKAPIISAMSNPHRVAKVLLLAETRTNSPKPGSVPVKRYRLARLAPVDRGGMQAPFEHLKRTYD